LAECITSLSLVSVLSLFCLSPFEAALAGPGGGHDHSHSKDISKDQAMSLSKAELESLVESRKVPASWASANVSSAAQVGPKKDWMVQYKNQAADKPRQNLFIFISKEGKVLAVNHEGLKKAHSHDGGPAHSH